MSATQIGMLLDTIIEFPMINRPRPVHIDAKKIGMTGQSGPVLINPRSVAQATLAHFLRENLALQYKQPATFDEDDPCPTYQYLARMQERDGTVHLARAFEEEVAPHALILDGAKPSMAIEIAYGLEEEKAIASIDNLLKLMYFTMTSYDAVNRFQSIAFLFVHELSFGEIIYKTEMKFHEFVHAHFGPFFGMDRNRTPMMPRLTRTVTYSPPDGTYISAIDLETRPTGYAAFCISYERDRA